MRYVRIICLLFASSVAGNLHSAEAPVNNSLSKYEVLEQQVFFDKEKIEHEWQIMPFESLTLEKSGCFGTCAVSITTFHKGGKAEFNGKAYTKLKGSYAGEITLYEYALLTSLIERTGIEGYKSRYVASWTDDETVKLRIKSNGVDKVIVDYGRQAPPEFQAFRALFDEIQSGIKWAKAKH